MILRGLSIFGPIIILVTGCDQEAITDKLVPEEEVEFAKTHLALYQSQDFDAIISQLNPEIVDDEIRIKLEELAGYIPDEEPVNIDLIGSNTISFADSWSANLTFQYQFSDIFLIIVVVLSRQGDQLVVDGVHVQTSESSLEDINRFDPNGRGFPGYIFLALAAIIPLFIIVSLVVCLRTPIPKKKWIWALFVLIGVGTLRLNWTTGEVAYSMFSWQLLGSGFIKPTYGPLILSIALPFGAIVFWMRRKEWIKTADEGET